MKDYGLVSIITPSWNCGQFVGEMIKSVQQQGYQNWELLFQDDFSTDNTEAIVKKMAEADPRIKYDFNECNRGAAITRNNALQRACGRWIAFLDSDDLWMPDKLEHQLNFMVENDYVFSYHEYTEISEEGKEIGVYVSGIKKVNKFDMYACCWPGCLTVMYDRDAIGLVQIKDIRKNNDTAIWLKVVKIAPCYLLKENLACYRRRKMSITPKPLYKRILAHYPLFHISEEMGFLKSSIWTLINILGNGIKKIFYVKRYIV